MSGGKLSTTRNAERSVPAAVAHAPAPPAALAQRLGNHDLQRLLQSRVLQAKLTVSDPGDAFEQEADRVADQVMRMAEPASVQRKCDGCEELRRTAQAAPAAPRVDAATENSIAALSGRGSVLPDAVRGFMEPRFNADFSAVRIHNDAHASELARAVNAQAFTVGRNVVFGAGHYAPETESGRRLLAHELAHVLQSNGGSGTLHRQKATALDVTVPDPQGIAEFEPAFAYPWQNPHVRAKVFPGREMALRAFLYIEKRKDLEAELAKGAFSGAALKEIGGEIVAERDRLNTELAEHARLLTKAQADLKAAAAQKKAHLADPGVRDRSRTKAALQQQHGVLARNAAAQRARIAELEKRGDKISRGEQAELDKRRDMLSDLETQLAPVAASLEEVSAGLAAELEPLESAEKTAKEQSKEHAQQQAALQPQVQKLGNWLDAKKNATAGGAMQWRLRQFDQHIQALDHDELLGEVLDLFAADPTFARYPKQVRYLVIHFSGMRYKSAHGTFARPQALLAMLKEQEIRELFAGSEDTVQDEVQATEAAVTAELASPSLGASRRKALQDVKNAVDAPGAVLEQLYAKNPQQQQAFSDWQTLIQLRAAALRDNDAEQVALINERLKQLEQQFGGAAPFKQLQARIGALEQKQLESVREFRVREARRTLGALSDAQALGVLQQMRRMQNNIPDWVWDEVVRLTQLHVNVSESSWKDTAGLPKTLDTKDPVTARWKQILDSWTRDASQWHSQHSAKYEVVATSIVCNQLSELAQRVYGKDITQGIRGAANWYMGRAKTERAKGVAQSYFMRPTKATDFLAGAGVFWARFEAEQPYKENMAHALEGIPFLTEGKQAMKNDLKEGDWIYHVAADGDITRTKGTGDKVETQWFAWQHEATVIERGQASVTLFETSGGARVTTRGLRELVDPMAEPWVLKQHRDTNVFVGFAPEGSPLLPALDDSLRNIVGGRDAL